MRVRPALCFVAPLVCLMPAGVQGQTITLGREVVTASRTPQPAEQVAVSVRSFDAEALRAAGIVVWFDKDELTGGDAWDQKIRTQIAECALFVPLISAKTQARLEGYFRLEWRLAEQRSHLMAKGKRFLVP
eukprot:gene39550-52157_t